MVKINDEIFSEFNHLVGICEDGQKGYRLAAKREQDQTLRLLFNRFADEKAQFAAEIKNEVLKLNGNPDNFNNTSGSMSHRQVFTKAVVTTDSSRAIIAECEREEGAIGHVYEEVLKRKDLPPSLHQLIKRQHAKVQDAHHRMTRLNHQDQTSQQDVGSATEGAPD